MSKTQKELAFLRELNVDSQWTARFTDFADKHIKFSGDEKNFLYLNVGTGNHAIALREKLDESVKFSAVAEDKSLLNIARDKAVAVRAAIDFPAQPLKDKTYDAVLADAMLARPAAAQNLLDEAARVTKTGGKVALLAPTAGSFGEIFSFLWEIFFSVSFGENGAAAEKLIADLPTVSKLEEMAAGAGLKNVKAQTSNEVFEYENGAEFVNSTLVADFLLPVWLESLDAEQRAQVNAELIQLVDAEDGNLHFRFSVKATLITGEKA